MTTGSVRPPAASDTTLCCCAGVCVAWWGGDCTHCTLAPDRRTRFCIAVLKWTDRLPYECACVCLPGMSCDEDLQSWGWTDLCVLSSLLL